MNPTFGLDFGVYVAHVWVSCELVWTGRMLTGSLGVVGCQNQGLNVTCPLLSAGKVKTGIDRIFSFCSDNKKQFP